MKESSEASFFSSLMRRYPNPLMNEGIRALPENWQSLCKEMPLSAEDSPDSFFKEYARVEGMMHPSWKREIVSCLPKAIANGLSSLPRSLSHLFLEYATLQSSFKELPDQTRYKDSPLFFLLQASQPELEEALEFLPLFSLVEPYLKIVDKKRLGQIARLLSVRQKKGLSFLLLSPKRFPIEPIDIDELLRKGAPLGREALSEKGLELFMRALGGEEEAFVRLVGYKMDMEIGEKIVKRMQTLSQKDETAGAVVRYVFECVHKMIPIVGNNPSK